MTTPTLYATCHCRAHRLPIPLPSHPPDADTRPVPQPQPVDLCYCLACRRSTGAPFNVYFQLAGPLFPPPATAPELSADAPGRVPYADVPRGIRAYKTTASGTRYFCATCGCHLALEYDQGRNWHVPIGALEFAAATHALPVPDASAVSTLETTRSAAALTQEEEREAVDSTYCLAWHQYLSETGDGALSRLLQSDNLPRWSVDKDTSSPFTTPSAPGPVHPHTRQADSREDVLRASCRCGGVRACVRRPLAIPSGPGVAERGSADGRRWLAGHCFCSDCRLTSGFPLSSWTYVGREHLTFEQGGDSQLVYYQSSERARRGFCGRCGASVTWDGGMRTVDIATALFEVEEGEGIAGVEEDWTFLEDEPSYGEDARDRVLLEALTKGMKENAGKGK